MEEMNKVFEEDQFIGMDADEVFADFEEEVTESSDAGATLIDKIKSEGIPTKVKAIGLAALCMGVLAIKKIKKGKAVPAVEEPAATTPNTNEVTVKLVVDTPDIKMVETE